MSIGGKDDEVEERLKIRPASARESALESCLTRLAAAERSGTGESFELAPAECARLFDEGARRYRRSLVFFHLRDWVNAESESRLALRLIDFVRCYAERDKDYAPLEQSRLSISRMNAVACARILLDDRLQQAAAKPAGLRSGQTEFDHGSACSEKSPKTRLGRLHESVRPASLSHDEGAFIQQGEYWTVEFRGQVGRFKARHGLRWLCHLLRHPGREFHVSELRSGPAPPPMGVADRVGERGLSLPVSFHDVCPVLDPQAKAEYKRCLQDLRKELEEAERFNDPERAARAQSEISAIARQLASAVGLGGRDRPAGSEAERARSAVTKRIKESIVKIGEVLPSLGRHLTARVKTGYFCSYSPDPDWPVSWRF